ncbi:MAG: DesA family fatty acid desaturase [Pseudomonadota bacterium]
MWQGLLSNTPWWGYLLFALAVTHVTIAGVTIYLHRNQAHKALTLHPVVSHFFRFWLWLTTGMVTREWVAVHRKHHARVETEEDPHSPQIHGIGRVLFEGAYLYRQQARNAETVRQYGKGAPDDWVERNVYSRFAVGGIVLMLAIDVALFGLIGIAIWAVQMMWIPFWAAGVINGIGHYWGYRNHATTDASTNIVPWGIVIGGEELHNNHHAHASSARFSHRPGEFDLGWFYIRVLAALGLAKVKKEAPRVVVVAKEEADTDTVRAIVTNRMQVLARYSRDVMDRLLRDEIRHMDEDAGPVRRQLRRLHRALRKDENLTAPEARQALAAAVQSSPRLRTAQAYREQLQAIWQQTSVSHEQRLKSLKEWCAQAESSGIEVLAEFARRLRGYTVRQRSLA